MVYAVFEMVLFTTWAIIPAFALITSVGDQFYLMVAYNLSVLPKNYLPRRVPKLTRIYRGAIVGRVVPPTISDHLGAFNMLAFMTTWSLVTTLAIWLPFGAKSAPALYVVVVLMGIGTGSFSPLPCKPWSQNTSPQDQPLLLFWH